MRAKQVTALMMAATLAVTSNGVTALAAETGDSSAAVAEVTDEVVSPELEEVVKGAQTSDDAITVTATTSKTEVTYGDTVEVTTAVDTGNLIITANLLLMSMFYMRAMMSYRATRPEHLHLLRRVEKLTR